MDRPRATKNPEGAHGQLGLDFDVASTFTLAANNDGRSQMTFFRIGDFSQLAQVSTRTLRLYDELGLLKPVQIDRFTGYRYYLVE